MLTKFIKSNLARDYHYRRRWYYLLWTLLLMVSIGLWVAWEIPAESGYGRVGTQLRLPGIPPGTSISAWAGPHGNIRSDIWGDPSRVIDLGDSKGTLVEMPPLQLPFAKRRWADAYIPKRTWDLVVIRLKPPSGPTRYFVMDLTSDWNEGTIRPGRVLRYKVACPWEGLATEAIQAIP